MRWLVGLLLLCGCQSACRESFVSKELGKTEADYEARYGPASKSPMTPDQIAFSAAGGARLVARTADGRSVEELWCVADDGTGMPAALATRGAQLLGAHPTPSRTVEFQSVGHAAAEIFEVPDGDGTIIVDRRRGAIRCVALCAQRTDCQLLDLTLQTERRMDELIKQANDLANPKGAQPPHQHDETVTRAEH